MGSSVSTLRHELAHSIWMNEFVGLVVQLMDEYFNTHSFLHLISSSAVHLFTDELFQCQRMLHPYILLHNVFYRSVLCDYKLQYIFTFLLVVDVNCRKWKPKNEELNRQMMS